MVEERPYVANVWGIKSATVAPTVMRMKDNTDDGGGVT